MQRRNEPSLSPAIQALQKKINGKQHEYENLVHLKDLSTELASQMEQLSLKIATLSLGTDAIADVLSGWANVFRAINICTSKIRLSENEEPPPENQDSSLETLVRVATDDYLE